MWPTYPDGPGGLYQMASEIRAPGNDAVFKHPARSDASPAGWTWPGQASDAGHGGVQRTVVTVRCGA